MSEKVTRSFYLKKAVITVADSSGQQPKTLKEYLKMVFDTYPKADSRKYRLDEDSERFRVMNDWKFLGSRKDVCAASVFAFTMYANQNAVELLSPDSNSFPITQLAPIRDEKSHQEFVEGLVWFAALGNYVAVMTNQAVTFSALEEYLSWIIGRACGCTVLVSLDEPKRLTLRECEMSQARRIVISNNIDVTPTERKLEDGKPTYHASGRGWNVLKAVYRALGKLPPRLPLDNENSLAQIDVDVIISARRFKSGTGRLSDAVERFANSFKDVENPPVAIEFSDGRKVSIDEYRVKKTFQIEAENKIPKAASVCALLDDWLRTQVGIINTATV